MVLRRIVPDIIGCSQRYSTMATKQPALDFLSFVNAAPTRVYLLSHDVSVADLFYQPSMPFTKPKNFWPRPGSKRLRYDLELMSNM